LTLQELANIGEFVGGIAVIISLLYLAVQIRQNTKAVQSASYHQAAEQTWSALLAVAQDQSLGEAVSGVAAGREISAADQTRVAAMDASLLFGFENMLRLREQGLVDPDVWDNVFKNSISYLGRPRVRQILSERPGPLSSRLLSEIQKHRTLFPEEPAA
jgi:hypothetical protein